MRCKLVMIFLIWSIMSFASINQTELYVFVSFSMPDTLIKQYVQEAKNYGAKVVIKGLIDNDFAKTQAYISKLLEGEQQGGIQIDPELFKEHDIKTVPAILLKSAQNYDVVYGAVPIKYALELFQNAEDVK